MVTEGQLVQNKFVGSAAGGTPHVGLVLKIETVMMEADTAVVLFTVLCDGELQEWWENELCPMD